MLGSPGRLKAAPVCEPELGNWARRSESTLVKTLHP